jgi:hypothetical protein
LTWVNKKLDMLPEGKRVLIESTHSQMRIVRQGGLVVFLRLGFDSRP